MTSSAHSFSPLTVITDDALSPERIDAIVAAACGAGEVTVQLRARSWSGRDLLASAERLRAVTRDRGSLFVINARVDVALAVGADGVHLPADGIGAPRVRSLLDARAKSQMTLGVSIHSVAELGALDGVADTVQFGPIFHTPAKERFGGPQGIDALRRVVEAASALAKPLRIVAVGGITPETAELALGTGAAGVAVIRAVMGAGDPAAAVRAFRSTLARSRR